MLAYDDERMGANPEGAYITLSSLTATSFMKLYAKSGRYFSILTAIISVKMGNIQGITWDDGCPYCEETFCTGNTYLRPDKLLVNNEVGSGESCYFDSGTCAEKDGSCDLVVSSYFLSQKKYLKVLVY